MPEGILTTNCCGVSSRECFDELEETDAGLGGESVGDVGGDIVSEGGL